ncbi:hypothetical protein M422DRAFT_257987 [Sphaerobolus stellatus SS14]|uniref:Uncharacterized protein n=1 Tax=Sphaerobolus stellatus (strain SS14) TaxID=990650 RepID=A0A0C9U8L4_SPHS4|nr:hypothetical protein M422DRAFT_257987 [Sphaerobolus stellatus SS14]
MSGHQGKKSTGEFRVRFANMFTQEANKENVEVKARQAARQILWSHLDLRPKQCTLIQALYDASENGDPDSNQIEGHHFAPSNPVQQNEAASILMTHSLDSDSMEDIGSRWSVKWSKKTGKGKKEERRTLPMATHSLVPRFPFNLVPYLARPRQIYGEAIPTLRVLRLKLSEVLGTTQAAGMSAVSHNPHVSRLASPGKPHHLGSTRTAAYRSFKRCESLL